MTLVSVTQVQKLVCDIINMAEGKQKITKSDIQHRLVYEIGIMPRVIATDEQMLDLLANDDIEFLGADKEIDK